MALIQKLTLGLALAGCVFMTSCSQEDVQVAPPPSDGSANSPDPNRGVPLGPNCPTTNGTLGQFYLAPGWALFNPLQPEPYDPLNPPGQAGTSSLTHLWGNQSTPWSTPLPQPTPNASRIATFTLRKNGYGNLVYTPIVATLSNLVPGKTYSVKIYGATTYALYCGDASMVYGYGITIETLNAAVGSSATINLAQKQAEWDSATLVFTAGTDEVKLKCSGYIDNQYDQTHGEFLHYLHVYADQNSIKELL